MNWTTFFFDWLTAFGTGGAFFVVSVGAIVVCGLALWLAILVVKHGKD